MLSANPCDAPEFQRRRIGVRGQVQGVGFRPYVYRMAEELGLRGWVCNCGEGAELELQGEATALQTFVTRLQEETLPQARIVAIEQTRLPLVAAPPPFFIATSRADGARTAIATDTALCDACLEELFDPASRRHGYPFINCVHCGPRFTIIRSLPFDRASTSMADFSPCPQCRQEYQNPADRRFHAQANCCPRCGPTLSLHDAAGVEMKVSDVIASTVAVVDSGGIVAVKGLGGFHLLCDARNRDAVERLRARKGRETKPFAVIAANAASLSAWAKCDEQALLWLQSPARPIVLLEKAPACDAALDGVAPGIGHVGVLFPYTPLHYLLFHQAAGPPEPHGCKGRNRYYWCVPPPTWAVNPW